MFGWHETKKQEPETLNDLLSQMADPNVMDWQWVALAKILREICIAKGISLNHPIEQSQE